VAPRWQRPEHDARVAALGTPDSGVRVISYNVLANAYRHTWDAGIHTHCKPEHTRAERRIPMAIDEVLSYAPSIIALQEVDPRWFERLWLPRLRAAGYDAALVLKSGAAQEGEAVAWRKKIWSRVESRDIALSIGRADAAAREVTPPPAIAEFLAAHPARRAGR
jgi:mRNA deadenylase 3'-5' endonuclease subunit Ccr4